MTTTTEIDTPPGDHNCNTVSDPDDCGTTSTVQTPTTVLQVTTTTTKTVPTTVPQVTTTVPTTVQASAPIAKTVVSVPPVRTGNLNHGMTVIGEGIGGLGAVLIIVSIIANMKSRRV